MRDRIKLTEGSIQDVDGDSGTPARRSTARPGKFPMRSLIDMVAERGAYIDQSASR